LPGDMYAFYKAHNGVRFYSRNDSPYRFLRLDEIRTARFMIYGDENESSGPEWLFAFCDVRDGNYVGIDLRGLEGMNAIVDCFHETFPDPAYSITVDWSFKGFLAEILGCNGRSLFWLEAK
jgi:hypothetical protein